MIIDIESWELRVFLPYLFLYSQFQFELGTNENLCNIYSVTTHNTHTARTHCYVILKSLCKDTLNQSRYNHRTAHNSCRRKFVASVIFDISPNMTNKKRKNKFEEFTKKGIPYYYKVHPRIRYQNRSQPIAILSQSISVYLYLLFQFQS